MQKIGINTNCECGANYFEICDNIKKSGIESIMIALIPNMEKEQFEYAKKLGLNVSFVHLDNTETDEMWVRGNAHNDQLELYKKQIALCAEYGVKIAVLHATKGRTCAAVVEPTEFALDEYKKLVEFAKSKKVKIALENLDNGGFKHFKILLDNIKSPYFGFCYDFGHHNLYNKDKDLIGLYGDRLLAVHLHSNLGDYELGMDYSRDLHMLPFDGTVDYNKVVKQLKAVGYKNTIMIETNKNPKGDPKIYKDLTNLQFLEKAKAVMLKLRDMMK